MNTSLRNSAIARVIIGSLLVAGMTLFPAPSHAAVTPDDGTCDLSHESNQSPPVPGSHADPYLIGNETELKEVLDCDGAGKHFKLSGNVVATAPWTPLATSSSPFIGNVNGAGFSITGIEIETFSFNTDGASVYRDGLGIFRAVRDSAFSDLVLETSIRLTSGTGAAASVVNVGGLTGWADNSSFESISSSLIIEANSAQVTGMGQVGGLVGSVQQNMNAALNALVVGTQSINFHNVSTRLEYDERLTNVGGIVGKVKVASGKSLFVSESSSVLIASGSGTVHDITGGLVGGIEGQALIIDSFATGDLALQGVTTKRVGGILGQYLTGPVEISSSYSVIQFSNYSTQTSISSTVGHSFSAPVGSQIITNTFWNSSITSVGSSAGAIGATTTALKDLSTFRDLGWSIQEGFDQASIWGIHPAVNDGYPFLTGNYSADPTPTAPVYTGATAFSVAEGSEEVGTLTTTPSSQWTVSSDASGLFSIDSQTGELTVSPSAAAGSYAITVRFTGSNLGFGTQVVNITIAAPQVDQGPEAVAPMPLVPEIIEFSSREVRSTGDSVTVQGRRLAGVSSLTLGGISVTIIANTATSITFTTGEMPVGVWDLRLVGSNGTLVFQQAIEVVEATAIVAETTGELLGYTWTLKFIGNSRSLHDAQAAHLIRRLNSNAETVICWGYTTAANPKPWTIAHATARAKAACDFALANSPEVKTIVRLRYGVAKDFAMRAALQFWK